MANNLVVQLLLKTGTFSSDLKTARGQIQNFQQSCSNAGKTLTQMGNSLGVNISGLTKLGTVAGVAVAAVKGFKSVMESTQTTSDKLDDSIAGVRGVVDALKVSLAQCDFSSFKNGLWDIFDAAVNTRRALDDLADARLGYGMISSDNRARFSEAQNNYREARENLKNAKTTEEREKWQADMAKWEKEMRDVTAKEEEAARNFQYKNMNAIKSQVHQFNPYVNEKDVTEAAVMAAAEIFNSVNSDQLKDEAKKKAKTIMKSAKDFKSDSKAYQYLNDYDKQFDLVVAALVELGDEKIKAVAEELQAGRNARTSASSMRRSLDRTVKPESTTEVTRTPRTTKTGSMKIEYKEGQLGYYDQKKKEAEENLLLAETKEEYDKINAEVEEWQKKIDAIKGVQEEVKQVVEGSRKSYDMLLSTLTEMKENAVPFSDEYNAASNAIDEINDKIREIDLAEALMVDPPTIDSLERLLALMKQIRNETAIGSEDFKNWSELIEKLQKKLNEATGVKDIKAPEVDSWEEFNKAMSNTSTIVSSLTNTFKDGAEVTASSILAMVSTALPALGSLISSIQALTAAEAVEAGVAATGKAVSSSKHWIEAIAAVAALGSVVAAALSSAKSQKFANGGIVGGTSFTGDRVSAQVNSGEMILNKAQQARLFKLANGGGTGGQVEFHISGTELVGVLNNNNRKNNLIR